MEIEKYSPKWLLEKINTSKTDAHKLMHIIEYRKELVESTEKQFAIYSVSDTLIAWEQFKKANWYESEAIDVEKMLMDKFQAIYGR